ncbi:MAG: VCBS repeat-containing protein, partial [Anaerolineae bacterium]|nr:VCBS repeat-containing protein [Anaerolineae bacterium]
NLSKNDIQGVRDAYGEKRFKVVSIPDSDLLKGDFTDLIIGDFNGDGKTDFIRQEKGAWDDDSIGTAEVWLSRGNGTFDVVTSSAADRLKGDFTNLITGDFNGDGKTDFIRQEKGAWDDDSIETAEVWLSRGNGTFDVATPNAADRLKGDFTNLIAGDFNGDGKTDFIRQ